VDTQRGSSLIEAVITFALLSSVLLSSLGLFTFGERRLRGARASSQALAAARSILEETESWSFAEIPGKLGVDGASATYAIAWTSAGVTEIPGAVATVHLESLPFGGVAQAVRDAKGVRIVVSVEWDETGRHREARAGTVRN